MENLIIRGALRRGVFAVSMLLTSITFAKTIDRTPPVEFTTFNLALSNVSFLPLVRDVNERSIHLLKELDRRLEHSRLLTALDPSLAHEFVWGFQEAINRRARRRIVAWARNRGLHIAESPGTSDLLTISTIPIVNSRFISFSQNEIGRDFGVLASTLRFPNGKEVRAYNTHTSFSLPGKLKPIHQRQLEELAAFIHSHQDQMPEILLSDINMSHNGRYRNGIFDGATPYWDVFNKLLAPRLHWVPNNEPTWNETMNALVKNPAAIIRIAALLKIVGFGEKESVWGLEDTAIDHIFASPHWKIQSTRISMKDPVESVRPFVAEDKARRLVQLSDHYACTALLSL